jgi:hypothetical protein
MSSRLILAVSLFALAACDASNDERPQRYRNDVFVYTTTVPAGKSVTVRNLRGSITVEPSADDTLRVRADLAWRGDEAVPRDIRFSGAQVTEGVLICSIFGDAECSVDKYTGKSEGGLRIGTGGTRFSLGGKSNAEVSFRIQVPAGVKLDLLGIDGDIVSASSAPVKARMVNGDVTIATAVGPVNIEVVNGDIDARMTTLGGTDSVITKTLNGDVWVFLPETAGAVVDAATTNGELTTDFPLLAAPTGTRKKLEATLGAGGTPVYVRTLNGTVGIGRLDAQGRSYPRP